MIYQALVDAHELCGPLLSDLHTCNATAQALALAPGAAGIARLPSLTELWALRVVRLGAPELDVLLRCRRLRTLIVERTSIADLSDLAGLRDLEVLAVHAAPRVTTLRGLTVAGLQVLGLSTMKRLKSLDGIEGMPRLRELYLTGPLQARWPIASLAPIAGHAELQRLGLRDVRIADGSLRPLWGLRNLKQLDLSHTFSSDELAKCAARLPQAICTLFQPVVEDASQVCKRCGGRTCVALVGVGKPTVCSICDQPKVDKHIADWAIAASAA